MRVALLLVVLVAAIVYGVLAVDFWRHERSSQSLRAARALPIEELKHPEATLGLIRDALAQDNFSTHVGELVKLSREQIPAYYQPPALQALFHASRLEEPDSTRESFESAIERYPANGQLHLDYARWLLIAPSRMYGLTSPSDAAVEQLRQGLVLEPTLTRDGLRLLAQYEVPPERWAEIIPRQTIARRALVAALVGAGHKKDGLVHLRALLHESSDPGWLRQVAELALTWGDPELALDAVRAWKAGSTAGFEPYEPGLFEATAELRLGRLDAGYDTFRAALDEIGPATSAGLKLLCGIAEEYIRLRQFVLAESLFMEAIGYSPSYPRALLGLARLHVRLGNEREAAAYYERVLAVDPSNERAKAELLSVLAKTR